MYREIFSQTFSIMMMLFVCILIGFCLRKKNIIPDNAHVVISKLENYVLAPALIIVTFMNYCTIQSLTEHYTIVIYSCVIVVLACMASYPLSLFFARKGTYERNIYKYAISFANFGFMGNVIVPVILAESDPEILYKYLLFTLPLNFAVYSWGVTVLINKKQRGENSIKKNLLNPCCISIAIGVLLGLSGAYSFVPDFINEALESCKLCMGPLAMILAGIVIGEYPIKNLLSNYKIYIVTVLRLILIPVIIVLFLKVVGASEIVILLAFFAYATPLGLNTVVFPAAYGGDTTIGASMALVSHTLSVISIPMMYAWVNSII